tara:strand:- start:25 stop:156 length:132 start_codon:yes stop_codon:yes gene_type:complete
MESREGGLGIREFKVLVFKVLVLIFSGITELLFLKGVHPMCDV